MSLSRRIRSSHVVASNRVVHVLAAGSCLVVLTGLVACGRSRIEPPPDPTPPAARVATIAPSSTPISPPRLSPVPTEISSPTPPPTATRTPTATSTPLHPLTIESLRQRDYDGGEILIEKTLAPGANYDRFIASYRSEGLVIYALMTVPQGEKPASGWPVIVFNHGYIPPDQYRTTERYVAYVDGFARNGYIVFRSDYRGHGSSEGEARGAYGFPDYTIDVLNAVASLRKHPDADPERIGMWGHSMGGSITLQALVVTDDVKAGVIWAGMSGFYPDILEWRRRRFGDQPTPTPDPEGRVGPGTLGLVSQYGAPEENPEFWSAISATSYLADTSAPIQIHHGTADTSVPYEWSEELHSRLVGLGKMVEFYGYEGDNHNLSNQFGTAMSRSVEFFDTYLKGRRG